MFVTVPKQGFWITFSKNRITFTMQIVRKDRLERVLDYFRNELQSDYVQVAAMNPKKEFWNFERKRFEADHYHRQEVSAERLADLIYFFANYEGR